MQDQRKTKAQLIEELKILRHRVSALENEDSATRQAEVEMQTSQAMLAEAERLARLGSWDWDFSTGRVAWSDEMFRIFGLEKTQIPTSLEEFMGYVHPDDIPSLQRDIEQGIAQGYFESEYRIIRPDGETRVVRSQAKIITDGQGNVLRMAGAGQDITERVQTEAALRESEERYRLLAENAGTLISELDAAGKLLYANPWHETLLGYSPEELVSGAPIDLSHPDEAEAATYAFVKLLTEGGPSDNVWRFRHKNGQWRWFRSIGNTFSAADGKPRVVVVSQDITERNAAEAALRESEARFRNTFEYTTIGKAIIAPDGRFTRVNRALTRILGYTEAEMQQLTWSELTPPDHVAEVSEKVRTLLVGQTPFFRFEHKLVHKDGHLLWVDLNVVLIRDDAGKPLYMVGHLVDISAQKQAEASLKRSEARYRDLFEHAPIPLWEEDFTELAAYLAQLKKQGVTDLAAWLDDHPDRLRHCARLIRVTDVNQITVALHRAASKAELLGNLDKTFTDESFTTFKDEILAIARGDQQFKAEGTVLDFLGNPIIIELHLFIYQAKAEAGQTHRALVSTLDITARKQAEQELHRTNRALRVLSDCNQAVVRATEEIALCQDVCQILVEIGGYRLAWVGYIDAQKPDKTVHPVAQVGYEDGYLDTVKITWDDSETGRGPTGTAIRTGQPIINQNILTNPDYAPWREQANRRGYASSIALPLIADSKTLGVLNIYSAEPDAFDSMEIELLTELAADLAFGVQTLRMRAQHRRAETEVRQQLSEIELILNTTLDGYILADTDGQILEVNPSYCALTGYTAAELTQMNIRQIEVQLSPEDVTERIEQMVAHGRARFESIHRAKDGRPINLDVSTSTVQRTPDDAPLVAAFVRDVTERKQAEVALRDSEARFRGLMEQSPLGIQVFNADGYLESANNAWEKIWNADAAAGIGKYNPLHDPQIKEMGVLPLVEQSFAGQPVELPDTLYDPATSGLSGHARWIRTHAYPLKDDAGNILKVVVINEDITERKRMEQALSESLAEKETLIRELYHRTKNNMQVIGSMLSLQSGLTANPEVKKVFRDTGLRIRSMGLVHQMLYQSKNLSRIKLDEYINNLAQLLHKSYGVSPGKVALRLKLQPVSILIDIAIPCGLLLNELIANALEHAFPGERRGEITVELSRADCGRITLVVADNGVGLPPDFDFASRDTFGLQALKGIAELQLQGELSWETENGLTCRVEFQDDLYDERV